MKRIFLLCLATCLLAAGARGQNVEQCIFPVQTALQGSFDDGSGDAQYGHGLNCTYLIQPPDAKRISLYFTEFAVDSTSYGGRAWDYVEVYDGATHFAPLLARYTGVGIPPPVLSTGGALLIRFVSDTPEHGGVDDGWRATYSAVAGMPPRDSESRNAGPVFPGDADNNGVVDETDFFVVSSQLNKSGPPRAEEGVQFRAYAPPAPWAESVNVQGVEVNNLYQDANGDGHILLDDLAAAIIHRGKTQPPHEIEYNPRAHRLDSTEFDFAFDLTGSNPVFEIKGKAPTWQVGDVIYGDEYGGYGYVITEIIETRDGRIVLEATRATLEDIVSSGNIRVEFDAMGRLPMRTVLNGDTIESAGMPAQTNALVLNGDGTIKIDGGAIDFGPGKLSLSGKIDFNPRVVVDLDIDWEGEFIPKPTLKQFDFYFDNAGLSVELTANYEAGGQLFSGNEEKVLGEIIRPISLGPIPAALVVEFVVAVEAKATATMNVETTVGMNARATLGARYDHASGWQYPYSKSFSPDAKTKIELVGEGNVRFYVFPRIKLLILGAAGPVLEAKPYANLNVVKGFYSTKDSYGWPQVAWPWQFNVDAGIEFSVGGEVGVLGRSIAKIGPYDLGGLNYNVWKAPGKIQIISGDNQDVCYLNIKNLDYLIVKVTDNKLYGDEQGVPSVPVICEGDGYFDHLNDPYHLKTSNVFYTDSSGIAKVKWTFRYDDYGIKQGELSVLTPPSPFSHIANSPALFTANHRMRKHTDIYAEVSSSEDNVIRTEKGGGVLNLTVKIWLGYWHHDSDDNVTFIKEAPAGGAEVIIKNDNGLSDTVIVGADGALVVPAMILPHLIRQPPHNRTEHCEHYTYFHSLGTCLKIHYPFNYENCFGRSLSNGNCVNPLMYAITDIIIYSCYE